MVRMKNICDKDRCTACSACVQICPVQCVRMNADSYGFNYPEVGLECIGCGLCKKICPAQGRKTQIKEDVIQRAFCAIHRDYDVWIDSSSGGAMTALCQAWIGNGGVVYGVQSIRDKVRFCRLTSLQDLQRIRGSKYVQSSIGNVYKLVKKDLQEGRRVVFIGVPCQVAGLSSFVGSGEHENLLLIDLICHGVGSPLVFSRYLDDLEVRWKKKIIDFRFRNKRISKNGQVINYSKIVFDDCQEIINDEDLYCRIFYQKLNCRISCYNCLFANTIREGDFTIADFNNLSRIFPDISVSRNASTLIANSRKAETVLFSLNNYLSLRECSLIDIIENNSALSQCTGDLAKRDDFLNQYFALAFPTERLELMEMFQEF